MKEKIKILDILNAFELGLIDKCQAEDKLLNLFNVIVPFVCDDKELDCPYDFTSRCTMGRCNCKPKN